MQLSWFRFWRIWSVHHQHIRDNFDTPGIGKEIGDLPTSLLFSFECFFLTQNYNDLWMSLDPFYIRCCTQSIHVEEKLISCLKAFGLSKKLILAADCVKNFENISLEWWHYCSISRCSWYYLLERSGAFRKNAILFCFWWRNWLY